MKSVLLLCAVLCSLSHANVYDVVLPKYRGNVSIGCECQPWTAVSTNKTEQARINSYWLKGVPPSDASNHCAMPAASAGQFECDGCTVDAVYNSFKGPWCYCKDKVSSLSPPQPVVLAFVMPQRLLVWMPHNSPHVFFKLDCVFI